VDGETLRARLKRIRLSVVEELEIAVQISSALAQAHHANIVHRDIKPENVMVRPDGLVKILDFGLAKLTHRGGPEEVEAQTITFQQTKPGMFVGTVSYMSPEQARGSQWTGERTFSASAW